MELDNQTTKQAYIQMLSDVLKRKLAVLNRLMELTGDQEVLMKQDTFDEEAFSRTIDQKGEQLELLTKLDTGFEQLYENVREELSTQKSKYFHEITTMQEDIASITDLSVKLQAMEKRNRTKLEQILSQKRREIKSSRMSSQTVAKYYKTIANQNDTPSFFYDKKK